MTDRASEALSTQHSALILPSDNPGHPAVHTSIERSCAFRKDLNTGPSAYVLRFDFEKRVDLIIRDCRKGVEDRLLGPRVLVHGAEKIEFVVAVILCHRFSSKNVEQA